MKSLVFLSQKGGSGKTTLSVHTAVTAQESGEQVVIIDTDPQQSATTWADARESDSRMHGKRGFTAAPFLAAHQSPLSVLAKLTR